MEDYQQRVVDEQKDLTEKLVKLVTFIASDVRFFQTHPVEQTRMQRQRDAMLVYSDALGSRIAAFKGSSELKKL